MRYAQTKQTVLEVAHAHTSVSQWIIVASSPSYSIVRVCVCCILFGLFVSVLKYSRIRWTVTIYIYIIWSQTSRTARPTAEREWIVCTRARRQIWIIQQWIVPPCTTHRDHRVSLRRTHLLANIWPNSMATSPHHVWPCALPPNAAAAHRMCVCRSPGCSGGILHSFGG